MSGSIKNDCIICVPHYSGIGTEIRENPVNNETKVVVNMSNGLGRYEPEDAAVPPSSSSVTFEWYLKNHLGSTMLVYASGYGTPGVVRAAYDYRAFGEMVELTPPPTDKVTETFTGKEHDDEIALDYFGARYLDPMLGLWISVDAKRQYQNPYLYAGNNPIMRIDPDGNQDANAIGLSLFMNNTVKPQVKTAGQMVWDGNMAVLKAEGKVAKYTLVAASVLDPEPVTRNMANAATVALDVIEGYCENGGKGAAVAGTIDLMTLGVGKFFPDNIKNRLGQAIFSNFSNAAVPELFKYHLSPTSSDEIIPENIISADKTNVEW